MAVVTGSVVEGIPLALFAGNETIIYQFVNGPGTMTWCSPTRDAVGISPLSVPPGSPIWTRGDQTMFYWIEDLLVPGNSIPFKFVFETTAELRVNVNTYPEYDTAAKAQVYVDLNCGRLGRIIMTATRTNVTPPGMAVYRITSDKMQFTQNSEFGPKIPGNYTLVFDRDSVLPVGFAYEGAIQITFGGGMGGAWNGIPFSSSSRCSVA
jgi:hypothetical protein